MKLTKLIADKAKYEGNGKGRCVLWDSDIKGFGLRIYPSGRKSFIYHYRVRGRMRLLTLGDFGILTVDEARKHAREQAVSVNRGADPLQERQTQRVGSTIKDLCEAFIERHAKPKNKSWEADQRRFNQVIIPEWGNRRVDSIQQADVALLHHRMGKQHKYAANRTIATLSKLFSMAVKWGMIPHGTPNPAKGIDRFPEKSRDRWLHQDELPRLVTAIAAEPNVYIRGAIWLYLFTGVRKTELLTAKWSDIDLERRELRLEDTKAGRIHYVPLSAPAMQLLQTLPRMQDNPYVLPGQITGKHLVNISKPWLRIRKAAGLEDVRLHDLRRTVGSWLAQSGKSLQLIGKVLNHSNLSTSEIYARFAQDNVRDALEEHGKRMLELSEQGREESDLPKTV